MLKDCLYETEVNNLFLLPAGVIPPNPSELLQSERLPDMIEELKKVFDVVIFDFIKTHVVEFKIFFFFRK